MLSGLNDGPGVGNINVVLVRIVTGFIIFIFIFIIIVSGVCI